MASSHTDLPSLRQSIEEHTFDLSNGLPQSPAGCAMTTKMPEHKETMADVAPSDGEPPSHDTCHGEHVSNDSTIAISATSRSTESAVAPFLAKYIPGQYNPMGSTKPITTSSEKPDTKFCYRHRPDALCRKSADEPTMEKLQRDLESLPQEDRKAIAHVWALFSAAPGKQRTMMLQGMLKQCCFPQLSFLATNVRELIKIDFMAALPSEISFKILCYLDTTSLCKAAQVSQKWRILADDDVVWHKMCEQHIDRKCTKCGWGLPLLERKRLRDWKRQQQLRATGRGLNQWSPRLTPIPDDTSNTELIKASDMSSKRGASNISSDGSKSPEVRPKRQCTEGLNSVPSESDIWKPRYRPWKDVYKDRFKVGTNWKYGRCSTRIFRGHTNGVTCLQFDDNILATGSYDTTIKIWDIETGECLRTLEGHTVGLRTLQFDDTKLISGSLDHTIKVWNWRTGKCLATYGGPGGHTDGVIGIHFEGNLLASASMDSTLKVWNFEDSSVFSLRGHKDIVNAVRVDTASRTVFSASDDCTIRLWDLDTRKTIKIYEGHVAAVQQIVLLPTDYEPEEEVSEEHDDSISNRSGSVDVEKSLESPFEGEQWPATRPQPSRYMLTGALDSTVRLWDVNSGRCLKTFFGHLEGVWALAGDNLRVVSGAEDGMMKVWDARTGKCERTFTGHAGAVTCIGLSDSRICTGGIDDEVRMYSFKSQDESSIGGDTSARCSFSG